ncbi:glycyl-tRNA synthetase [Ceraceosorus guamensis]|uniref:glycine--tRNA ligase n=1 Tax=Ceraceosorus guamensis TaxID=1522189 RepID=A0A316W2L8_9BASI|nr:glycyl-tRNA synthetase [Ceraceosorus guamensis]PWN43338.1 glycyl-tRNA synthetase [Ceraceosorus guamensis]
MLLRSIRPCISSQLLPLPLPLPLLHSASLRSIHAPHSTRHLLHHAINMSSISTTAAAAAAAAAADQDGQKSASNVDRSAHAFSRPALEGLMTKRFFYTQAFEIYGGVAGLYDYGPTGASLQSNIINTWRQHFILEEEMLELDTTIMTLHDVLKTSGHVDKFSDWMCKDLKNGEIFRADHLLEGVLEARLKGDQEARSAVGGGGGGGGGGDDGPTSVEAESKKEDANASSSTTSKAKKKKVKSAAIKLSDEQVKEYEYTLAQIDNYTGKELGELIRKFQVKAPESGNDVTEPVEFNLMFETMIGPTGYVKGYLRPETAQGHFVNFSRLLDFNNGRVPFASAHIGKSFRNEISPRAGLLRVREFTMAEIEHYVDPLDKSHDRFVEVSSLQLPFLPKDVQQSGKSDISKLSLQEAVKSGMVDNETLGYFLGRIYLFLLRIGIDPTRLRFRQHMANEMAHYASDCWDAEIHTSYGWIECVGCADRSAYDLTVHAKKTGRNLVVQKELKEPKIYDKWTAIVNKKKLGPLFRKEAKAVEEAIDALTQEELEKISSQIKNGPVKIGEQSFELDKELLSVELKRIKETVREFVPNVIEPSFGIGRIFYSLLEHSFWARAEDAERSVLSLPPSVAPFKALVLPISSNKDLDALARRVARMLRAKGIMARVDDSASASIGKRYARNDELGTPFACTLDFASISKGTMTLRERDTTSQRIGSIEEVVQVIKDLCDGNIDWQGACQKLPAYSGEQQV